MAVMTILFTCLFTLINQQTEILYFNILMCSVKPLTSSLTELNEKGLMGSKFTSDSCGHLFQ